MALILFRDKLPNKIEESFLLIDILNAIALTPLSQVQFGSPFPSFRPAFALPSSFSLSLFSKTTNEHGAKRAKRAFVRRIDVRSGAQSFHAPLFCVSPNFTVSQHCFWFHFSPKIDFWMMTLITLI